MLRFLTSLLRAPKRGPDTAIAALVTEVRTRADHNTRPAIQLDAQPGDISRQVDESRIGGRPAWPTAEPWPVDDMDVPMIFVAQINFADVPELPGFPDHGLLQLFIRADGELGAHHDAARPPAHLVLHRTASRGLKLPPPLPEDMPSSVTPFDYADWRTDGIRLTFAATTTRPALGDPCFADLALPTPLPPEIAALDAELRAPPADGRIGGHINAPDLLAAADDDPVCLLSIGWMDGVIAFGDVGRAYLLLPAYGLRNRDFTATRFLLARD